MPPAKSKRSKQDWGEISEEEEEDDGPTKAKKRMLEQNLVQLSKTQLSPKKTATGVIRVCRDPEHDKSDPPVAPFIAVVETVSLVVPESLSQRSQNSSGRSVSSSETPNFKAFVRKGRKGLSGSQSTADSIPLCEYKLQSYDRSEYQTLDNDRDRDSEEEDFPVVGRGRKIHR